ncbi:MAG TPA: phosphoglycerate dehydrogenase [Acidimicrobiales bacterium]|nr:phosphoglycerate dehydrogenase [Acidimicrobiales bacterium]
MTDERPPRRRALLLENIHPGAADILGEAGFEVETEPRALDENELAGRLAEGNTALLGIRSRTQVTEAVLDKASHLLAVGAFCIGTNQIDLPAATRRGITVFNAPFSNTRSVVELVIAEIIALTRRLTDKNREMHAGVWSKSASGAHEVRGRRLGIVGYGNIGSQLSVLAENLGMSVAFYDTADRLALGNARRMDSLEDLLAWADVVTLHVDGRPDNRGLFGEAEFAAMRQGSLFLNLSRGFVVDHGSLREHIESGHIAGAAVDVFLEEPSGNDTTFNSRLQGLPNVILTPHIGGSTEEAQVDIGRFVAKKLADYVRAGSTALSVNMPNVDLPARAGAHGLVHIHRNTPGVLAAINAIFAEHRINIEGQALGTRGEVGYVITDIASDYTDEMLARLAHMDETIRLRVL